MSAVRHVDLTPEFFGWSTVGAWNVWARRVGLDPRVVMVPGFIEADDDARQVTALCLVLDEDGDPVFDRETADLEVVNRVIQLEEPAPPMPEVF